MISYFRVVLLLLAATAHLPLAQPPPASEPIAAHSLGYLLSRLFSRAVAEVPRNSIGKIAGGNDESPPVGGSDVEEGEDDSGTASALLQVGAQARFGQGASVFHGVSKSFFEDEDAPVTNSKLQSPTPAIHSLQFSAPNDVGSSAIPALNLVEVPPLVNISGDANSKSLAVGPSHRAFFADEDEQEGPLLSTPSVAEDVQDRGLSFLDDNNEDANGVRSNEDAAVMPPNNFQSMSHHAKATQDVEREVDASNTAKEKQEDNQTELKMEKVWRKSKRQGELTEKEEKEEGAEEQKKLKEEGKHKEENEHKEMDTENKEGNENQEDTDVMWKAERQGGVKDTEHERPKAPDAEAAADIRVHSTQVLPTQVELGQMNDLNAKRKRKAAEALAFVEGQANMGDQEMDEATAPKDLDQSVDEPDEIPYPFGSEVVAPASQRKAPTFPLLAEQQHEIIPAAFLGGDDAAQRGHVVAQDDGRSKAWLSKHKVVEHDANDDEIAEHKSAEHEATKRAEREAAEENDFALMTAKREASEREAKLRETSKRIAEDTETQRHADFSKEGRRLTEQEVTERASELLRGARLISEETAAQENTQLRKARELTEREAMLHDAQLRAEAASVEPRLLDQPSLLTASWPSSSPSLRAPSRSTSELSFLSTGRKRAAGRAAAATAQVTFGPEHSACTPKCTWRCQSSRCDELCEPECEAPRCETRCAGIDLSGCAMECQQPHCAVMCPNTTCPSADCPTCTTTCSEPMCKLKCSKDQPCRNVCEQPNCRWKCRAPEECPAPKCEMACESPQECFGATFQELPPLNPGETMVQSFAAPAALQVAATRSPAHALGGLQPPNTVPVQFMTMPGGAGVDTRLRTIQESARVLPVMLPGGQPR